MKEMYRKSPNAVIFAYERWRFIFKPEKIKDCRCFDNSEIFNILDQLGNDKPFYTSNCTQYVESLIEDLEEEGFITGE